MMDVTQFPAAKCWQRLSFQDEPAQKPRYLTASFLCSIQWLTAELLVSFLFKTNNTAFTNSRNISRIWPFLPDKHLEAIPTTSHRSVAARADLEIWLITTKHLDPSYLRDLLLPHVPHARWDPQMYPSLLSTLLYKTKSDRDFAVSNPRPASGDRGHNLSLVFWISFWKATF